MNSINDRMQIIVDQRFGGNKAAFAKSIGLGATALSNYLGKQRRSKPNVEMITNIIEKVGVDPMWLLTGQESPTPTQSVQTGNNSPATINNGNGNTTNISNPGATNALMGAENEICNLKVHIDHLNELIKEKDARIKLMEEIMAGLRARLP